MVLLKLWKRNRAIKKIALSLPPFLVTGYGISETYTIGQIERAMDETKCNSTYSDYAFAMFCDEENFNETSSSDYESIRSKVADLLFDGNKFFRFSHVFTFGGGITLNNNDLFDGESGGGDGGGGD